MGAGGFDLGEVKGGVGRNAVEPGANRGPSLESGPALPRPQQGLLHQVFRVIERAQHPVAMHVELTSIRLCESRERSLIARSHTREEGSGVIWIRGANI